MLIIFNNTEDGDLVKYVQLVNDGIKYHCQQFFFMKKVKTPHKGPLLLLCTSQMNEPMSIEHTDEMIERFSCALFKTSFSNIIKAS